MPLIKEPARSNQRLCSHEDVDGHNRKQSSADESEQSDPRSPRTVPRRHTVGGPRTAGDVIIMQSYNMDHKKEAFLEHLKQKYPHHASVIMGHQERLRDQVSKAKLGFQLTRISKSNKNRNIKKRWKRMIK